VKPQDERTGEHPRPDETGERTVTARLVLVLVVLALGVRIAFVPCHRFALDRTLTPDSVAYLELARSLTERAVFGRGADAARLSPENPGTIEVFRTPGYPALLAAFTRLNVAPVPAVVSLQILLDVVAVVFAFFLALTMMPPRWASAVGLVLVIDVARVVYANMVMSDVVFTFLISGALYLVAGIVGRPGDLRILVAGVALTLATAVRPVGLLAVVPFAVFLGMRKASIRMVALFALTTMAFPLAWTVRNGTSTGQWVVSNAFDYNLCLVAAAKVKARAEGIPRGEAQRVLIDSAVTLSRGGDLAARSAAFRRVGWQTLCRYPGATVREAVWSCLEITLAGERRNLLRLVGDPRGSDTVAAVGETARGPVASAAALARRDSPEAVLVATQLVWNGLLWAFALVGAVTLARHGRWAELLLFGLTLVVVLVPSLVVANGRMRMPVSAVVALLAIYGLWTTVGHDRRPRLALS
jgi:hypothetical protein